MIAGLHLLVIFFLGLPNHESLPTFQRIEGLHRSRLLIANAPIPASVSTELLVGNSKKNGFELVANQRSHIKYRAVLDICSRIELGNRRLSPREAVYQYVDKIDRIPRPEFEEIAVSVLKQTKHGTVVSSTNVDDKPAHHYTTSDPTWMGKDRAEYEVRFRGKFYKIIERIELVQFTDQDVGERGYSGPCNGFIKRIRANGLSSGFSASNQGISFSKLLGVADGQSLLNGCPSTTTRCFKSNELFSMDAMPSARFCASLSALHKTSLRASAS
jgi:hypothetical protein